MIISKLLKRADRSSRFFQPDRRPVRRFMPCADGLEDRSSLSIIILGGAGGVLGGGGGAPGHPGGGGGGGAPGHPGGGGGGGGNGGNASGGAIANSGASFSDNHGTFTNNQANGGNGGGGGGGVTGGSGIEPDAAPFETAARKFFLPVASLCAL